MPKLQKMATLILLIATLAACAAPGGKTAHLLELAELDLLALDSDPLRLARVQDNLNRLNLRAELKAGDELAVAVRPSTATKPSTVPMLNLLWCTVCGSVTGPSTSMAPWCTRVSTCSMSAAVSPAAPTANTAAGTR